jgi:hypothetical protein
MTERKKLSVCLRNQDEPSAWNFVVKLTLGDGLGIVAYFLFISTECIEDEKME